MSETNVTAIMLTLNEADIIKTALDSAAPAFDELSILDGGSTDGTVEVAEQWCEEHGKDFVVTHSSEREYLLEGAGTQRRRAEDAGSNPYSLAVGADVEVHLSNPEWFTKDFKFDAYVHTRRRPDGDVERDYRLYRVDNGPNIRWRGLVHEELRAPDGTHVHDALEVAEAPMVHEQKRQGTMETRTSSGMYQHRHDPAVGGNLGENIKKQHYLLKRAMDDSIQHRYLSSAWKNYYHQNKALVADHWESIHDEYDLPYFAKREGHETYENELYGADYWMDEDYKQGKPVMGPETDSFITYSMRKLADIFGKNEPTH